MTVPNTISDAEWAKIRERASKAAPPMFSDEAVKRRKQAARQQQKADQN